jgi:pyruvate dehydrogenase E1 component alpha subunit
LQPALHQEGDMTTAIPDRATLLEIYRRAELIKQTDERFRGLLTSGQLAVVYYSPRGQEIISAATAVNLRDEDYVVTIYRGIHDHLAKGVPLKELLAEFAGKVTGTCKGKGGPMHITHPKSGVMVTTGIVGSGMPIANGLAWASQLRGDGRVTVTNFGDGASNIGAFHEALNLASLWKLPVVFLCQNNGYAECTRYEHGTAVANIAERASAYNMRGVTVDGNDPIAMYNAAREAIEHARNGEGPTLLEAKTFRFMGHYFGDTAPYIPKEELSAAMAKDPVPGMRAWLIANGHASDTELSATEAAIRSELDDAVEFALNSDYPNVSEMRRDIFSFEIESSAELNEKGLPA